MMLFSFIYSALYSALIVPVWLFRFLNKKLTLGFKLRKSVGEVKPWLNYKKHSHPIWFHCASGEYEYAKPVIRLIKQTNPKQKVMVTYFSPSVEPSLASSDNIDFYCPTPWDTFSNWQDFIDHHQPQALLIARTDLWPMMIHCAQKNDLPRLLFSKTVNKQKGFLQNTISNFLMKKLSEIFCASEEDRQALFKQIKPFQKIHAAGDTRYDQCLFRLCHGKKLKPLNNFNKPLFVAGSTWPSDEFVLLPLIADKINDVSFIVAPHEPSKKHISQLTKQLDQLKIKSQLYSRVQSWDPQAVLIIDQVGILADLYAWGNFAFVGASMDRAVHSVMEPLAQGLLTFIGPCHENSREALSFKQLKIRDMTPVQEINDYDELLRRFQALYRSWSPEHKTELKIAIKNKSGASQLVHKWLLNNQKGWT